MQHALDYTIYGWGGAFDVGQEVTINSKKNDWCYIIAILQGMYTRTCIHVLVITVMLV